MGSGVRNLYEFSKIYSGTEPKIEEGDVFKTTVKLYDKNADGSQNHTESAQKTADGSQKSSQKSSQKDVNDNRDSVEKTVEKTMEKTVEKTMEKTVEKILSAIKNNPSITQNMLKEATGLSRRGVEWQLNQLKKQGIIRRVGPDKGGHWIVFPNTPSDLSNIDTTE